MYYKYYGQESRNRRDMYSCFFFLNQNNIVVLESFENYCVKINNTLRNF